MTAQQLRKVLAQASNRDRDYAATWGMKCSDQNYRAWLWVTAKTQGEAGRCCIPGRGYWESWELEGIRRTIQQVTDLVALDDNA